MPFAKSARLLAASGAVLALSACKVDNRPLLAELRTQPQPTETSAALPQPGLPPSDVAAPPALPPERVASGAMAPGQCRCRPARPAHAYPYAERAYGFDQAFYQAPPDYGFAYEGEEPWVWQASDESLMFAEPYGDDYRFYYYEPGAPYPYFVRDAGYGYAFGGDGALVAIFDAAGALLSADAYPRDYPVAERYWTRGYDLRRAYLSAPRYAVDPGRWQARAPVIAQRRQAWLAAPERQPAWRAWRASADPALVRRYDTVRPARVAAAQIRTDNGRHLGWTRGRHEGQVRSAPPAVATARLEPRHAERFARAESRPHRAPSGEAHGRPAAVRAAVAETHAPRGHGHGHVQMARAAPPPPRGREAHGGHGGGAPMRLAEARAPSFAGSHGGGRAAAQAHPQKGDPGHGGGHGRPERKPGHGR